MLLTAADDHETAGSEPPGGLVAMPVTFLALKADPGLVGLDSLLREVAKLQRLHALALLADLFTGVSPKLVRAYYARIATESTHEVRRHPLPVRAALVAAFCHVRQQQITDGLVDLLLQLVRKIGVKAEKKVEQLLFADFKRVGGKPQLLYRVAAVSLAHPTDRVCDVIYPAVGGEQTLLDLMRESTSTDRTYRSQMHTVMRASYRHHYRRMLPVLLRTLQFRSNNATHRPRRQCDLRRPPAAPLGGGNDGVRLGREEVRRVGPEPDDGVEHPPPRARRDDLLARREARDLHLLATEDGLVIRSGGDDRRGAAPLHHDGGREELRRFARAE